MLVNVETKFNVGDTGYAWMFGNYKTVTVTDIQVHINDKETKIHYEVDDSLIQIVEEEELLIESEAKEKQNKRDSEKNEIEIR